MERLDLAPAYHRPARLLAPMSRAVGLCATWHNRVGPVLSCSRVRTYRDRERAVARGLLCHVLLPSVAHEKRKLMNRRARRRMTHADSHADRETIDRTRWAAGLAAAGASVLMPTTAAHAYEPEPYVNLSLFGTYTFGATQPWGMGLDARVGATGGPVYRGCSTQSSFYYGGGALRFEWFPQSHTRLTLVAQGGRGAAFFGGHAEVGVGYRLGTDAGLQTLIGGEFDYMVAALALRVEPLRGEFSPSFGALFPSVVLPGDICEAVPGRPHRADVGLSALPSITASADGARRGDDTAPAEVVALWGRRAQTELASVPAFRDLAAQLHVQGAPQGLVERCHQAARDEIHHAMLAANHSAVLGSCRVQLDSDGATARTPIAGPAGMVRLAVESWVDGCLGEGAAASAASLEADLTDRDDVRRSQLTIARDEAEHAELAWDVLAWTLRAGGRDVRDALHAVAEALPPANSSQASSARFETFGILGDEQHRALAADRRNHSLQRLHETLIAG